LIAKAVVIIDDNQRDAALAVASEKAIELMGLIPLHYEVSTWASRKGIQYGGRADQYTLAQDVKRAK
jgi:peptide/nickel transport system substrate-binding protein